MRYLLLLPVLALALAGPPVTSWADSAVSSPTIELQDEAANQGGIKKLNCAGAGVSCARSGVTGTITVSGGGGGSITVREVDGAPSVASVTTVEFDEGAGFVVTDQTGGVARVSSSGGGSGLTHPQVMARTSMGF